MSLLQFTPIIRLAREMCFYNLKLQLERELDRARATDLVEGVEAAVRAACAETVVQRCGRVTEKSVRYGVILRSEVRVIEDVEELTAEAKLHLLCYPKLAFEREVHL